MRLTPAMLWARVLSKSYISAMTTEQQAKIRKQVDAILQRHPEIVTSQPGSQESSFDVVVKTELFICQRKD